MSPPHRDWSKYGLPALHLPVFGSNVSRPPCALRFASGPRNWLVFRWPEPDGDPPCIQDDFRDPSWTSVGHSLLYASR